MIIQKVRFSYCNIFEPKENLSGRMMYSASLLIPKKDEATVKAVKAAIAKAKKQGIENGVFKDAVTKLPTFKGCLRDGDAEFEAGQRGEEYKGMYFINASNKDQPGCVDKHGNPIMDSSEFYSGCWGHVDAGFFPFNKGGGVGIGCAINNVMKLKDDDRIDGRQSATQAFASHFEQEDSSEDGELL